MKRKMKPVLAWALVWNDGDMYGDPDLYPTRRGARLALRGFKGVVCDNGEFVERIARVRITEVRK